MSYLTKEQITAALEKEVTPEEMEEFRKAMKPLMDMSVEDRVKFLLEHRQTDEDE